MNPPSTVKRISDAEFEQYVQAEVDGEATPEQLAVLEADRVAWRTDAAQPAARRRGAPRERAQHPRRGTRAGDRRPRVGAAPPRRPRGRGTTTSRSRRATATREADARRTRADGARRARRRSRTRRRRCSCRCRGSPAASSRGPRAAANATSTAERLAEMLARGERAVVGLDAARAGAGARRRARPTRSSIPVGEVLGWLVAAGADQVGDDIGPSVRWLGRVAIWAVELTARGAMVPLLRQRKRRSGSARDSNGSYSVRWTPALVDPARLARLARDACPASCSRSIRTSTPARSPVPRSPAWSTRSAATAPAGSRCRRRRRACAPRPTSPRRSSRRLDGSAFDAPIRIARRDRDARRALGAVRSRASTSGSIVRLDPPDAGDAWHLAVFASGPKRRARRRSSRRSSNAGSEPSRTSKTRSRASNACCPRSCARAARAAAR